MVILKYGKINLLDKDAKLFSIIVCNSRLMFQDVNWDMTLEEFNRLPHFEHEIIVHEEAVFMDMSRKHGEYYVFLYSLEDFFIEAYVFPETGKVAKYKGVKEANAYLGGIDISSLRILFIELDILMPDWILHYVQKN